MGEWEPSRLRARGKEKCGSMTCDASPRVRRDPGPPARDAVRCGRQPRRGLQGGRRAQGRRGGSHARRIRLVRRGRARCGGRWRQRRRERCRRGGEKRRRCGRQSASPRRRPRRRPGVLGSRGSRKVDDHAHRGGRGLGSRARSRPEKARGDPDYARRAAIPADLLYDPSQLTLAFTTAGPIHALLFVFTVGPRGLEGRWATSHAPGAGYHWTGDSATLTRCPDAGWRHEPQ